MVEKDEERQEGYWPRVADAVLQRALRASGAVQIVGAKWCGKTETAKQQAQSAVYLQDPDEGPSLVALAEVRPSVLLEGAEPHLIDEWQMAPQLWDAVRFAVDQGKGKVRFILTCSATPKKRPKHSGVGRISRMHMRPMSLFESRESTGAVSLAGLFDGAAEVGAISDRSIEDIAFALCRGGWPEAVLESDPEIALDQAKDYVAELLDSDIDEMDDKKRNSTWLRAILRSYARNISTEASQATIAADMGGEPPSENTVADYLDALRRTYVTEDLPAWNPALRSKTAVRTSPTRHFCDPSIGAALLGASPRKLLLDFSTFGLFFESLCVRDLRVYAAKLRGTVYHYRDKTGLEADAVVVLDDGRWGAVEVKLGEKQVEEGAAHLLKLASRVDDSKEGAPSFLMVLTGQQAAYCRPDGVYVVPITCLAP